MASVYGTLGAVAHKNQEFARSVNYYEQALAIRDRLQPEGALPRFKQRALMQLLADAYINMPTVGLLSLTSSWQPVQQQQPMLYRVVCRAATEAKYAPDDIHTSNVYSRCMRLWPPRGLQRKRSAIPYLLRLIEYGRTVRGNSSQFGECYYGLRRVCVFTHACMCACLYPGFA